MADMPDQGPSVQDMLNQLGGQIAELGRAQQAQAQTIQQLAQGTHAVAQQAQRAPAAAAPSQDDYQKANEKYLQALALDPIALRRTELAQVRQEIQNGFRQEMQQTMAMIEQGRRAED